MKIYEVVIPHSVIDQIENCFDYLRESSQSAEVAIKWRDELIQKIDTLTTLPERCFHAEEDKFYSYEVRCLMVGNYRVLFRILENQVILLQVKRVSQQRTPFPV